MGSVMAKPDSTIRIPVYEIERADDAFAVFSLMRGMGVKLSTFPLPAWGLTKTEFISTCLPRMLGTAYAVSVDEASNHFLIEKVA